MMTPAGSSSPQLVPPELRAPTRALWRLAAGTTAEFGSPRATRPGLVGALWRLPCTLQCWGRLLDRRADIAVHGQAHLVAEQLLPPQPRTPWGRTTISTALLVVMVAGVLAGGIISGPGGLALMAIWALLFFGVFAIVFVEQRLTRDPTTAPSLRRAAAGVVAAGHSGPVVRGDDYLSAKHGDGRQLLERWLPHLDAHGIAAVITARTPDLAEKYALHNGFRPVSPEEPLLMCRLPGPAVAR